VCLNQNNHETKEYNTQRFMDLGINRACQRLYAKIAVWSKSFNGSKAILFQDFARQTHSHEKGNSFVILPSSRGSLLTQLKQLGSQGWIMYMLKMRWIKRFKNAKDYKNLNMELISKVFYQRESKFWELEVIQIPMESTHPTYSCSVVEFEGSVNLQRCMGCCLRFGSGHKKKLEDFKSCQ
jgi:hypothetical protein